MKVQGQDPQLQSREGRKPLGGVCGGCRAHGPVLDLLVQIKGYQDGSLTFRRSCAHGVCGSDAMMINGHNRLACKVLVQEIGKHVTIEPLRGLAVIKDFAVDMEPFFAHFARIQPYLINDEPPPYTERLQSAEAQVRGSMKPPSASCARPAPPRARASGPTTATSARRPSCRRTASSSTTATRAHRCGWRSWPRATACGAAARSTTASRPVRADIDITRCHRRGQEGDPDRGR